MKKRFLPTAIFNVLLHIPLALLTASIFLALLSFIIPWWFLELFTHFFLQYCLAAFTFTLLFSLLRNKKTLIFSLFLFWITCLFLIPYLSFQNSHFMNGNNQHLTLFVYNTHYKKVNLDKLITYIQTKKPDILVFIELRGSEFATLQSQLPEYAGLHFMEPTKPWQQDISYLAKRELGTEANKIAFSDNVPSLVIEANLNKQPLFIVATHPFPPLNNHLNQETKDVFTNVTELIKNREKVVVVGDFNTTPFSPTFKKFIQESELQDTRKDFGLLPSWPTEYIPFFRIPIDHILHTESVGICEFKTGPNLESDHLPVIAVIGDEC